MAKVPNEKISIETTADDGTILKGIIYYWAKDYGVELHYPVKAERYGGHIPYFIPTTFIVDPQNRDSVINKNGKQYINAYVKGRELLKKLYEEKK